MQVSNSSKISDIISKTLYVLWPKKKHYMFNYGRRLGNLSKISEDKPFVIVGQNKCACEMSWELVWDVMTCTRNASAMIFFPFLSFFSHEYDLFYFSFAPIFRYCFAFNIFCNCVLLFAKHLFYTSSNILGHRGLKGISSFIDRLDFSVILSEKGERRNYLKVHNCCNDLLIWIYSEKVIINKETTKSFIVDDDDLYIYILSKFYNRWCCRKKMFQITWFHFLQ